MSKFEKGDYVCENDGTIGMVLDVEGESLCVCGGEHRYTYIGKVHLTVHLNKGYIIQITKIYK